MKSYRISITIVLITFFSMQNAWAFLDDGPGKAAPSDWGTSLRNVKLTWSPQKAVNDFSPVDTTIFQNAKITVRPFTDARSNPSEIGRNVEPHPSGQNRLVLTKRDVPAWITERFINLLQEFHVDPINENGAVYLDAVVEKFHVTEKSTYLAEVILKLTFSRSSGQVLWSGTVSGTGKTFGVSYRESNYHQTLSTALTDLVYTMLNNEQIIKALKSVR